MALPGIGNPPGDLRCSNTHSARIDQGSVAGFEVLTVVGVRNIAALPIQTVKPMVDRQLTQPDAASH